MARTRSRNVVGTLPEAQERWLAAYQQCWNIPTRIAALRDIIRRAMAGEAISVDAERTVGHTEGAQEERP